MTKRLSIVAAAPKTWEEFVAAAKKVSALGNGTIGYALPLGPEESQGEFSIWMFNNGGDWKTDGKWTINSPKNVETLTFLKDLAVTHKVTQNNPGKTNRADAFDLFKSGKAGMVVGFSPLAAALDKDGKVQYDVAPMPTKAGGPAQTFGVTDYLMAFKKNGNHGEARLLEEGLVVEERAGAGEVGEAVHLALVGGGDGAKATKIKLVAAEYSKDNTKAFWDAFAKTYKEKYGYDLEVQVVSWDNIDQQSSTMIQTNQAPDILNLNAYASYAKDNLLYHADEVLPADAKSDILDAFVKSGIEAQGLPRHPAQHPPHPALGSPFSATAPPRFCWTASLSLSQ